MAISPSLESTSLNKRVAFFRQAQAAARTNESSDFLAAFLQAPARKFPEHSKSTM
jgi:hypothetical protein